MRRRSRSLTAFAAAIALAFIPSSVTARIGGVFYREHQKFGSGKKAGGTTLEQVQALYDKYCPIRETLLDSGMEPGDVGVVVTGSILANAAEAGAVLSREEGMSMSNAITFMSERYGCENIVSSNPQVVLPRFDLCTKYDIELERGPNFIVCGKEENERFTATVIRLQTELPWEEPASVIRDSVSLYIDPDLKREQAATAYYWSGIDGEPVSCVVQRGELIDCSPEEQKRLMTWPEGFSILRQSKKVEAWFENVD